MLQPPWLSAHFRLSISSDLRLPTAPTSGSHRHRHPSGRAAVLCTADCHPPPCVKSQIEAPSCRLHFPHWIGVVPSLLPPLTPSKPMGIKTPLPLASSPPLHHLHGPIKCTPASAPLHRTHCSPPSLFSASPIAQHWAPPPPSPPLHRRPHPAIALVTKARGKDRQDPLYLFLQSRRAPCPCIVDEPALRWSSGGVLSSGPPWTEASPGLWVVDPVHRLFLLKNKSISYKFWEFYTEAPVFYSNYKVALGFRFYLISSPV
jgi:hypothetical protein